MNKRISVTPISLVAAACQTDSYVDIAKTLDAAAATCGVNFIGGFSALVQKGCTDSDWKLIRSIPEAMKATERVCSSVNVGSTKAGINMGGFSALVQKGCTDSDWKLIRSIPEAMKATERVCSSVNVGSTKAGINMDAVAEMGRIIKQTAEITADNDGLGCAKVVVFANAVEDNPFMAGAFHGVGEPECVLNVGVSGPGTADNDGLGCAKVVVFANAVEDNPFMAGAFHGVGEPECVLNVGVSGPGVVYYALQSVKGQPFDVVAETIKKTAFQITRMGQLVGQEASSRLGVPFGIVDLSLAPTPAVGDSVARLPAWVSWWARRHLPVWGFPSGLWT